MNNPFAKKSADDAVPGIMFGRLRLQEKVNFSRHLAIIIKAGLPLFEGLKIIRRQSKSKTLRKILDQLIIDINNGQSLAHGLGRYRNIFGDFFISIVEVGESSGTLADNLLYLAEETKKSKQLQSKVRSAMIYPVILLIMTIAVSSFLAFFLFPKLITAFSSLNVELPATTKILLATLSFLREDGIYVLIIGVALSIAFRFLLKFDAVKYRFDYGLLYLPVVSKLIIHMNSANFTRILGILLKSGVKIVEAVTISSRTFNNLVYREALLHAAEEIRVGGTLAGYLTKNDRVFPSILSAMVEVGENTGNLEENLFYLADYYTEEVETSLKDLTSLVEPLILIFMGLVVGFVALSIITPIYSLTQGLSK
jgi:type II secretory pathway component PulF